MVLYIGLYRDIAIIFNRRHIYAQPFSTARIEEIFCNSKAMFAAKLGSWLHKVVFEQLFVKREIPQIQVMATIMRKEPLFTAWQQGLSPGRLWLQFCRH